MDFSPALVYHDHIGRIRFIIVVGDLFFFFFGGEREENFRDLQFLTLRTPTILVQETNV
jgi:hypothetical protein